MICISSYRYGAIHGAAAASASTTRTINAPQIRVAGTWERRETGGAGVHTASASSPAIADLRIEVRVEKVGDQIGEAINRRDDENAGLDQRQIVAFDGEDQQAPQSRIGEH